MFWYVGWQIDQIIPRKVFETGYNTAQAWAKMTKNGLLVGRVHQKIYGPYNSFQEAKMAQVPSPANSA